MTALRWEGEHPMFTHISHFYIIRQTCWLYRGCCSSLAGSCFRSIVSLPYSTRALRRGGGEGRGRRRGAAAAAGTGSRVGGGADSEPLVAAAALLMQDAEEKPDGAMEVRREITDCGEVGCM